jgi:hypothetical protein
MRETAKCPTYNQALETGLKVAINFLLNQSYSDKYFDRIAFGSFDAMS